MLPGNTLIPLARATGTINLLAYLNHCIQEEPQKQKYNDNIQDSEANTLFTVNSFQKHIQILQPFNFDSTGSITHTMQYLKHEQITISSSYWFLSIIISIDPPFKKKKCYA